MYLKNKFFIFLSLAMLLALYFLITYSNKSNASINLNTTDNSVIENGKEIYAGVVDTVGGDGLTAALGQTMYGKAVAACGNAGGPAFAASVFPFILRGVKLLGIESVKCPREERMAVWEMLSTCLPREFMEDIATSVQLEDLVNMGPNVSVFYCLPYTVIDILSLSNKSLFNITDHGWRSTR